MSELKSCPLCGGNMKLEKVIEGCGTDGSYLNWRLSCTKCGITKKYAADGFYGREYYSTKEEVIKDWNELQKGEKKSKNEFAESVEGKKTLDKIRSEIEQLASRYTISRERGSMGQVVWSDRLVREDDILKIIDKYKAESEV